MLIYVIRNKLNGKCYVGQTSQTIESRFIRHCWPSSAKRQAPIDKDIQKFGVENFEVEVLFRCSHKEDMDRMELYYASRLNTFYPNGYNLRAGRKVCEALRKKIGDGNRGKVASDETRRKLSISHLGYKHSAEARLKLSILNKGKRGSPLCYQRAAEANQKTFHLISPDGKPVTIVNMRKFCRENGLSPFKMCEVYRGTKNHHHGWKRDPKVAPRKVAYGR